MWSISSVFTFIDTFGIFERIFLIEGNIQDLYFILETDKYCEVHALYSMDGQLMWYEFVSKGWNYSSGDTKELLTKYGINEHALDEKHLNKWKYIEPLF